MHASVILVLLALAAGGQQKPPPKPQSPPPQTHVQNKVFSGDAYLVVFPVSATVRTWYGARNPDLTVTKDDVKIVIENKTFAPLKFEADKTTPGSYLVSFSPPPEMRDRKPHQVEIKIKKASIKTTLSF